MRPPETPGPVEEVKKIFKKTLDKWRLIVYNVIKIQIREVTKMYKFWIEHKYCGMRKIVKGNSYESALRNNDLDPNVWGLITIIR